MILISSKNLKAKIHAILFFKNIAKKISLGLRISFSLDNIFLGSLKEYNKSHLDGVRGLGHLYIGFEKLLYNLYINQAFLFLSKKTLRNIFNLINF